MTAIGLHRAKCICSLQRDLAAHGSCDMLDIVFRLLHAASQHHLFVYWFYDIVGARSQSPDDQTKPATPIRVMKSQIETCVVGNALNKVNFISIDPML
jgi:hypothetical protein